jgi:hypothetical protein
VRRVVGRLLYIWGPEPYMPKPQAMYHLGMTDISACLLHMVLLQGPNVRTTSRTACGGPNTIHLGARAMHAKASGNVSSRNDGYIGMLVAYGFIARP